MKKSDNRGFVLAETLVVTVFLMTIFSMIYYYFYPLIGEYEKREAYDTVDDKYSVYWIKRIIEDSGYTIEPDSVKGRNFQKYGYFRFECEDVPVADEKQAMCESLVKALEIEGCTNHGNGCNIFITPYRIGTNPASGPKNFKDTVAGKNTLPIEPNKVKPLLRKQEDCDNDSNVEQCRTAFLNKCRNRDKLPDDQCIKLADGKVFRGGFQDYVELLPDYKFASRNGAKYRIIVSFLHRTDNNNYYTYATIEVG